METNKKIFNLLLNLIIAGIVIYTYSIKLIQISDGKIFTTVTGLDNLIVELLSFIISIIFIAGVSIVTSAIKNKEKKKVIVTNITALIAVSLLMIVFITYSSGNINYITLLLPMILASSFIKLRQIDVKDKNAGLNLLGYVWIYIGALIIAVSLDTNTNLLKTLSSFNFNLDQNNVYIDTITSLIYYIIIGIIMPLVNFFKTKKNIDLISI